MLQMCNLMVYNMYMFLECNKSKLFKISWYLHSFACIIFFIVLQPRFWACHEYLDAGVYNRPLPILFPYLSHTWHTCTHTCWVRLVRPVTNIFYYCNFCVTQAKFFKRKTYKNKDCRTTRKKLIDSFIKIKMHLCAFNL